MRDCNNLESVARRRRAVLIGMWLVSVMCALVCCKAAQGNSFESGVVVSRILQEVPGGFEVDAHVAKEEFGLWYRFDIGLPADATAGGPSGVVKAAIAHVAERAGVAVVAIGRVAFQDDVSIIDAAGESFVTATIYPFAGDVPLISMPGYVRVRHGRASGRVAIVMVELSTDREPQRMCRSDVLQRWERLNVVGQPGDIAVTAALVDPFLVYARPADDETRRLLRWHDVAAGVLVYRKTWMFGRHLELMCDDSTSRLWAQKS